MRLKNVGIAAVATAVLGLAGCGGGGTHTIDGKAVPTDPKAVCNLFADQSDTDDSDDETFSEKDYQEFTEWADHVEDDALSKDLRALVALMKQMPSESPDADSDDEDTDDSLGVAFAMLGTYESLTTDCAKYDVKLPDLMDTGDTGDTDDGVSEGPSEPAAADETVAFGGTKTYDDGLAVTVGPPTEFKPGRWASTSKAPTYVKFDVTIHNGTGTTFDPSVFSASMQSGSTDEDEVFDSDNGIGDSPATKLLDGRDATFTIGFGAEDPTDLVLDLAVDFEHDDAIFASTPAQSS